MCAIFGALVHNLNTDAKVMEANRIMNYIMNASRERGRDGWGYSVNSDGWSQSVRDIARFNGNNVTSPYFLRCKSASVIGNMRAEPTTEFVEKKRLIDQQPYQLDEWEIVHNGTIANDADLRDGVHRTIIDSATIVEVLTERPGADPLDNMLYSVGKLKGSYAILARNNTNHDSLYVACNYKPIWYIKTDLGLFFASAASYFPDEFSPQMVVPYSLLEFKFNDLGETNIKTCSLYPKTKGKPKCLVICSGGLDSVVAATVLQNNYEMDIELIHFTYGCRAQEKELKAVHDVGKTLGVKVTVMPLPIYKESDSPLLSKTAKAAQGEQGAEYAHEWVPARNLVLLSLATAYAEANGFRFIALGNNLEEAGAYPDNEPEFIKRFDNLLAFAVGDNKQLNVIMPVGNLMKHEIVKMGFDVRAPMGKTWSCYNHNELHCGKCGPCFMRKTAFEINGLKDSVDYASS